MPNPNEELQGNQLGTPTLETRMANLERRGEENYNTLKQLIKAIANKEAKLAEKVKAVDMTHLQEMEMRHDYLSERLQLLIDKLTVATECCYHLRHKKSLSDSTRGRKLAAVMWCMDCSDEWWEDGLKHTSGEGLTTAQWVERCFDTYRNTQLMETTNG